MLSFIFTYSISLFFHVDSSYYIVFFHLSLKISLVFLVQLVCHQYIFFIFCSSGNASLFLADSLFFVSALLVCHLTVFWPPLFLVRN